MPKLCDSVKALLAYFLIALVAVPGILPQEKHLKVPIANLVAIVNLTPGFGEPGDLF